MYPRTKYEMAEADLKAILDACKPTPCILIGGVEGPSQQDNANRAWQKLGEKMGFNWDTVLPIPGKGMEHFTAVPSETESQKVERIAREKEEHRRAEIERIKKEIVALQMQLTALG